MICRRQPSQRLVVQSSRRQRDRQKKRGRRDHFLASAKEVGWSGSTLGSTSRSESLNRIREATDVVCVVWRNAVAVDGKNLDGRKHSIRPSKSSTWKSKRQLIVKIICNTLVLLDASGRCGWCHGKSCPPVIVPEMTTRNEENTIIRQRRQRRRRRRLWSVNRRVVDG